MDISAVATAQDASLQKRPVLTAAVTLLLLILVLSLSVGPGVTKQIGQNRRTFYLHRI